MCGNVRPDICCSYSRLSSSLMPFTNVDSSHLTIVLNVRYSRINSEELQKFLENFVLLLLSRPNINMCKLN
jgi:hypothetical protein